MSATLDSKLFCSYFGGAPLVSVPGRTFPVSSYYLEDLLEETGHIIEEDSYFARRDRHWKDNEATLWVSTRGGEKRKETHALIRERDVSGDFEGYSMATQKYVSSTAESDSLLRLAQLPRCFCTDRWTELMNRSSTMI
jgi:HrpA-like RNA helicase